MSLNVESPADAVHRLTDELHESRQLVEGLRKLVQFERRRRRLAHFRRRRAEKDAVVSMLQLDDAQNDLCVLHKELLDEKQRREWAESEAAGQECDMRAMAAYFQQVRERVERARQ